MSTDLSLDPRLLDRVLKLSGEETAEAAVTLALNEFVTLRKQRKLADLFGQLDWDPGYGQQTERTRQ